MSESMNETKDEMANGAQACAVEEVAACETPETCETPEAVGLSGTSQVSEASSRQCALIAARAADEKKATDIMVQEVGELISVTDYFVIATAANRRQVEAIVDEIEERVRKEAHVKPLHREGTEDGMWALLDYGNFVVHVFQPETREYYRLEMLWNDAPVIDLAEEAGLTDVQYSDRIAKLLGKK